MSVYKSFTLYNLLNYLFWGPTEKSLFHRGLLLTFSSFLIMPTLTDLLYLLVIGFVRAVKGLEYGILRLFTGLIARECVKVGEGMGVVFHFTDGSYKGWSPGDEKKALSKARDKSRKLLHIRVHDKKMFPLAAAYGTMGAGPAYVSGMWDFPSGDEGDIVEFANRSFESGLVKLYYHPWNRFLNYLEYEMWNLQTGSRTMQVAYEHYDLGNDLYESFLDPYMQYTCAYWANSDNLNDAQIAKMELIAQKMKLKPGMRVLDIGCGWGMLCKYLAEKHKVTCVGVTISKEGVAYGKQANQGLPVEIRLQDYRDINENDKFDRIVSIGMFEHAGIKNHREYMEVVRRNLKDEGLFLLHAISTNHSYVPRYDPWLTTFVFPNVCIPRPEDIAKATEGLFVIEDWHNFGYDYATTLAAWRATFKKSWPSLRGKYGGEFYRMWMYYLTMCEGVFASRKAQLWQIVLSKDGFEGGYRSVR